MLNRTEFRKWCRRASLPIALAVVGTACQELQVENLVDADRERAFSNPSDVEAFVAGAFAPPLFNGLHRITQAVYLWPIAASEFTATMQGGGTLLWVDDIVEPRVPTDNGAVLSLGNGPHGPRNFWANVTRAASVAYDGLQRMDEGMVIRGDGDVDVTPRARAFAKFIQGWSWGYLGLIFDESHVFPETMDIPSNRGELFEVAKNSLVPYPEAIEAGISSLQEAAQVAQANPGVVQFPSSSESTLWFGAEDAISSQQFVQLANTLSARLLVLGARNPQERQQVDWNRVLQYTANGVTEGNDFNRVLASSGNRNSVLLLNVQRNSPTTTTNQRWDYRVIGPADQSGAYQNWINSPPSQRDRFDIVTTDRRITGPEPTSHGSYTMYRSDDNGFDANRGRYLFSAYQWRRHALDLGLTADNATGNTSGSHALISAVENDLLRAEALLRTGNAAGAAELINRTRTRPQTITEGNETVEYAGLPPVTAAGVPLVDGVCVPRNDQGNCGSLLDALRYERMIELAATDVFRGYADSRGWGTLPDGALLHWPVPGNVLELYGMTGYSYGGVGNEWSATYNPASQP